MCCACEAALEGTSIVIEVDTAAPDGVTVRGLKVHEAPVGRLEQAKLSVDLKPFCGVMVSASAPLLPASIVRDVADVSV